MSAPHPDPDHARTRHTRAEQGLPTVHLAHQLPLPTSITWEPTTPAGPLPDPPPIFPDPARVAPVTYHRSSRLLHLHNRFLQRCHLGFRLCQAGGGGRQLGGEAGHLDGNRLGRPVGHGSACGGGCRGQQRVSTAAEGEGEGSAREYTTVQGKK